MMRTLLAVAVLAIASPAVAEPIATMTLEQAMTAARQRPSALAAGDRADAADAAADIEWRRAVLPGLQLSAGLSARDRDLTLTAGPQVLALGDRVGLRAAAVIRQPILDPGRLFYGSRAARSAAEAATSAARRTRGEAGGEAADRFFDVLALDARNAALAALVRGLEARLDETRALAGEGRALDRDILRLRVALEEARRGQREIDARRRVAGYALGRAVGETGAVEPRFDLAAAPPAAPGETRAIATALDRRADLAALASESRGAVLERKAVWAELFPSIDLTGGWYFDDQSLADQDQFLQVSVNLVWRPFESGTRQARIRAARARESASRRAAIETRRGISLAVRAALADLAIAGDALAVASRGLAEAGEARRVTAERFRAGRETVGDLLEAESLVAERDAAARIAMVELWRAHTQLRVTAGELDR